MAILNISMGNIDLYTNRMYILYKWLIIYHDVYETYTLYIPIILYDFMVTLIFIVLHSCTYVGNTL